MPAAISTVILATVLLSSCIHPQIKYRKAKLLDAMMDPAKTDGVFTSVLDGEATVGAERGSGEMSGAMGASCPTCGG